MTRISAWAARHPWRWLGLYLVVTAALYQLAIRLPWWEGWPIHPSALDQAIPLLPWTAWLYVTYFLLMPSWVWLTRHHPEAGRLRVAAALCVVGNLSLNLAFPTWIADPLTPAAAAEHGALLGLVVSADRPYAAVPSGHLSLPVALLTLGLARRLRHRWIYVPWVLVMGLSILTTRQHYLVDAVGGLAWGLLGPALAWRLTRPRGPEPTSDGS